MRRVRKLRTLTWITPALLLVLFALVGSTGVQPTFKVNEAESLQVAQQVNIDLNEWNLIPEDFTFQAGDVVVFNITNTGRFPHALEVSNPAIHLHSDTIFAAQTTTLEVNFEYGGEYTFLCPIPDHAELGMVGTLTVEGGDPPPNTGEFLGIPLMRITPSSGTRVEGTSQEVRTIIHDFTLDADNIGSNQNVDGEGHWGLFLDDELVASVGEPSFTLENLTPGQHTIRAELRNNDGTPINPPVQASASIQVAQQVDIDLDEWSLIPEDFTFQAGDFVVFNIHNVGQFPHALEVSNSAIHLHSDTIFAEQTTTLAVNFQYGGEYTFLCPIPGHVELGMVGTLTVEGGDPPPNTGEFLGTPLMRITPFPGTQVQGTAQEVRVILHDFTLSPNFIGTGLNVDGQGNWGLFLDDEFVRSVGSPSLTLRNLTPGEHTIRVELRNNDGSALDPPVEASTTINVAQPAASGESPETPSVGEPVMSTMASLALGLGLVLTIGGTAILLVRRRTS